MDQPLASNSGSASSVPLVAAQDGARKTGQAKVQESPAGRERSAAAQSLSFQDGQTLAQLRRGNWAAMDQLVSRYQDRLYVTILRMVNHPEDAADLVQETFVRAMQGISGFEGKSSLYTWLFRIAINLSISHRRASRYRSALSLDPLTDDDSADSTLNRQAAPLRRQLAQDTEDDPAISTQRKMEYERLLAAIAGLDSEFRAVIILRDVEECEYEQIAEILDVPVGTVKSRLFRARLALRETLSNKERTTASD